jgi:predicted AlkP superfamily phosphohydrolase/phosphomutase
LRAHSRNEGLKPLAIGFDGPTFYVIRPMTTAGELPTLAEIVNEGAVGIWNSLDPESKKPTLMVNPGEQNEFACQKSTLQA